MYEEFYGLKQRPFSAAPSVGDYVSLDSIEVAGSLLVRCTVDGGGIAVVTGAAGTGKSLLCLRLREELRERFATVLLPNANFATRRSLLQAILYELGHPYGKMAAQEMRLALTEAVRAVRPEREAVVLIFDEAHLLGERLLEEVRTITNVVDDGVPLVRVILAGEFSLEETLAVPELEALNQRVGCQTSLEPLSQGESARYLAERIATAGGEIAEIFSPDAIRAVCQAADGSPRNLNQLGDHSLLLGYAEEERPAGEETVRRALADLRRLPLHWNEPAATSLEIEDAPDFPDEDRLENSAGGDFAVEESVVDDSAAGDAAIEIDWDAEPGAAFEVGHEAETDDVPRHSDAIESALPPVHATGDDELEEAVAKEEIETASTGFGDELAVAGETSFVESSWNAESGLEDEMMDDLSHALSREVEALSEISETVGDSADAWDALDDESGDAASPSGFDEPTPDEPTPDEPNEPIEPAAREAAKPSSMDERPLHDRYAYLDAGLPLPDDLPRPASGRSLLYGSPAHRLDRILPLLNEVLGPLKPAPPSSQDAPSREIETPVAASADERDARTESRAESESFEAKLGDQVLEVCLETQQAIDARLPRSSSGDRSQQDIARDFLREESELLEHGEEEEKEEDRVEYDVVQPEYREGRPSRRAGRRDYRRLFSALQRKR